MPVLHEYVASSENDGYYIYAMHDGANVTYQVTSFARNILDRVDACVVGERLPDEVFHALHRLGLVYTRNSGVSPPENFNGIPDTPASAPNLSPEDRAEFYEELLTSSELGTSEREELQSYVREQDIEKGSDSSPDLHSGWIPTQPQSDICRGEVARTFQDGDWGFIATDETSFDEDVFFHVAELDETYLDVGMQVDFAFEENDEGYIATHVRRRTDELGRSLDPPNRDSDTENQYAGETITSKEVTEGDFLEVRIDRISGRKGLSQKGFVHVYEPDKTSNSYFHIANRGPALPVGDWVHVKVLNVGDGYAEAQRLPPQKRIEAPRYVPP